MEIPLEKYFEFNFHTWKVKIHVQLMNKNLCGIVKGAEKSPTNQNKLLEWQSKDDKAKSIIALALSDLELHHIGRKNHPRKSRII